MNMTQIRYFITVAQMQSMTRAAELLRLSQPSLSKNIAKLEEELNTRLFDRSGRRITLSEPGKRFLDAAMVMLQELYDAMEEMEELSSGTDNRLSIGIFGAHPVILRYLAGFSRLHPEAEDQPLPPAALLWRLTNRSSPGMLLAMAHRSARLTAPPSSRVMVTATPWRSRIFRILRPMSRQNACS